MNALSATPHSFSLIYNFRDFGGYATPDGPVRTGLLFRSAHYADATPEDLSAFARLKMAAIVDLRRPGERVRYPTRRAEGCGAQMLSYGTETVDDEPPHLSFLTDPDPSIAKVQTRMTEIYREFAFDPGHIEIFSKAFRALSEIDGPLVVHCHAGKDRTGLIVALIHHLLGVSDEDRVSDYLRTNTESRIEDRLPEITKRFTDIVGRPITAAETDLMRHVYRVEPQYLAAAVEAIEAKHGSLDAYIRDVLGVTQAQASAIKRRLIAKP